MRKVLLSVAVFALAACQEISTSPTGASPEVRRAVDGGGGGGDGVEFPPPPPSDTGAVGVSDGGAFSINVTYMLNKPGSSGFLSFQRKQPEGVTVDPNARVQLHQGDFSGRGKLSVQTLTGLLVLDLANVSDLSSFESCAAPVAPSSEGVSGDEVVPDRGTCFTLVVAGGTFTSNGQTRPVNGAAFRPCTPIKGSCLQPGTETGPR
ncbi:MAG: hypothetical protein WKF55_15370 [Gemmatimonadaceae bacterium]